MPTSFAFKKVTTTGGRRQVDSEPTPLGEVRQSMDAILHALNLDSEVPEEYRDRLFNAITDIGDTVISNTRNQKWNGTKFNRIIRQQPAWLSTLARRLLHDDYEYKSWSWYR